MNLTLSIYRKKFKIKWGNGKNQNKEIKELMQHNQEKKKVKYSICDTKLMLTNDLNIFFKFKDFIQSLQIQM